MIIRGNLQTFSHSRNTLSTGRTIFLTAQSQRKQAQATHRKSGLGTLWRALALVGEVASFIFAPEVAWVEVGLGFLWTGVNVGLDIAINGKINWINFGIDVATSFIPALTQNKWIINRRVAQAEDDLGTILKTARAEGLSVEVVADIEKRIAEIRELKKLVAIGKLSQREFTSILKTTNRNLIIKLADAVEKQAFKNLPLRLKRIGAIRRLSKNKYTKLIGFFGTKKGAMLTQIGQLGNATDFAREVVKWTFYKPLTKIAKRFNAKVTELIDFKGMKLLSKKLTKALLRNTIPATASDAFERFRILSPNMIWVLFEPTNGKYYPPRLVIAPPNEITEFVARLTELGDAYDYYQKHFAYSKNGKDLVGLTWGMGAVLGSINLTAWRNILSLSNNVGGVIKKASQSGIIPFVSHEWYQDAFKALKRNYERKGGRILGQAVGGRIGAKFGTAIAKSITNESGNLRLTRKDGSYNWELLATTGVNTIRTYGIIYLRKRAVTGRTSAFADRQRFSRVVQIPRRIVGQAIGFSGAKKKKHGVKQRHARRR